MPPEPYNHTEYKGYLRAWIAAQPHKGHGSKAALARAAGCQTAYISQVILGEAHLSLEQGEKIAAHIGLDLEATRFFLLLIQKDRAGTPRLREIFLRDLNTIKDKRSQLKGRLSEKTKIDTETQAKYFSSWIYGATHLLARMPGGTTVKKLSARLGISETAAEEALQFISSLGEARMHLPHDSAFVAKHHANWRLQAMHDLDRRRAESLHYSSVVTISRKDADKLREGFLQEIERAKKVIKNSPEEELYSFCLDFFEV